MDDRLRFLYPAASEMWGHRHKAGAGDGSTGASAGAGREANPPPGGRGVKRSEDKSSEACGVAVWKSRYSVPRARTANRHRWTGRGSQGRRKKHCQGIRQNGPVTSGEGAPSKERGPQRIGPSNCLAKTQVYAKPKGEVYGLTPARCRKVKRRCKGNRSTEFKPR